MNIPRKQDGRLLRWDETPKIKSLLSTVISLTILERAPRAPSFTESGPLQSRSTFSRSRPGGMTKREQGFPKVSMKLVTPR